MGQADLIDRNRSAGGRRAAAPKGTHRDLHPPGEFWEYNDVRVNRLSLALLRLWRRPLPEVFRELVMDPIGASPDWEWHGYRNSYVEIDGRSVQAVSGGGHWGGGLFINARDQARIGLMMLRRGKWEPAHPLRGMGRADARTLPALPQLRLFVVAQHRLRALPACLGHQLLRPGAGGNLTWIDPDNDIVAVLRWTDPAGMDGFMGLVMAAIGGKSHP